MILHNITNEGNNIKKSRLLKTVHVIWQIPYNEFKEFYALKAKFTAYTRMHPLLLAGIFRP